MMAAPDIERVAEHLFAHPELNVFAVLDGASLPGLLETLYQMMPNFRCLYRGEFEPDMAEVAPYLVDLTPDSEFTDWILENGWGKHAGIFAVSDAGFRAVLRHLRSFLVVNDEDGTPLRFRYYDPRVFSRYIATCNADDLATLFGPVKHFALESEDAAG